MEGITLKKIILFLALVALYGCSDTNVSNEKSSSKEIYEGSFLEVAVVGSKSLPDIENVQYEYVELGDINGNKEEFDALIVTSEAFTEADKNKYNDLYDTIEYPVFFFGMKDFKMFAFTNRAMTIETSKDENAAYVEGFKNVDGKKEGLAFYQSEGNTKKLSDADMLIRIFNSL